MPDQDLQQQREEFEALEAIFAEDFCQFQEADLLSCQIIVSGETGQRIVLYAQLPADYPSAGPPVVRLLSDHLPEQSVAWATGELSCLFTPGEVVIYEWVEWLRAQEGLWISDSLVAADDNSQPSDLQDEDPQPDQETEAQGQNSTAEPSMKHDVYEIVHGEPFVEKKSTFQAHLAEVHRTADVQAAMACLLSNNKIQRATHNIMAFRLVSASSGALMQDCDDDGEDAAGKRLLHLLQIVDATNVLVVVSRWFGGVLLGPARFTHINNAARSLLQDCGYVKSDQKAKSKSHRYPHDLFCMGKYSRRIQARAKARTNPI